MNTSQRTDIQQLQTILKLTYGLVPIVAGLDHFTNILTNWSAYVPAAVADMLPFPAATFMMVVGVIEIIAGALVLYRPQIGAYVVSAWLVCIALLLILNWHFVDVAVRDLVMAIGAFVLARLSGGMNSAKDGAFAGAR
ncbi:MAG TPA: hypothetical protein PK760_02670 [Flavobacteriales bacterium]|nr:hypothetical protein [Flavobacteriales bacterium]